MAMSELKVYRDPKEGPCYREFYEKSEADKVIAELKAENERLTIDKRNAELRADVADATIEKLKANKQNLEYHVAYFQKKASDFQLMSDIRRVRIKEKSRALWLMTAEWAEAMGLASCNIANKFMSRENFEVGDDYRQKTIKKYRHRQVVFCKYADYCRNKAKEYK